MEKIGIKNKVEKIIKEISKEFNNFGVGIEEDEIKKILESKELIFCNEWTRGFFQRQVMFLLMTKKSQRPIQNFSLLVQNLKLSKEWEGIPNWFGEGVQLVYEKGIERYCFTGEIGRQKIRTMFRENVSLEAYDCTFFENKLSHRSKQEYDLKKIFEPEQSEETLKRTIIEYYSKFQKVTRKQIKMQPFSQQIFDLLGKLYDEVF